ncbi:MAG: hypothetical protein DMD33_17870 [Gemmatimonadetes bacterium]|nr:MAG: hypothetical protein DMD33_17870 [Gemmatimonadota bacterium]
MTFKRAIWFPIAAGLSVINLVGVGVFASDPGHATIHAVLALAFGLWAQRLRQRSTPSNELPPRLEALEAEVNALRHELNETQERLDFAERMLAQSREGRRVGPQP